MIAINFFEITTLNQLNGTSFIIIDSEPSEDEFEGIEVNEDDISEDENFIDERVENSPYDYYGKNNFGWTKECTLNQRVRTSASDLYRSERSKLTTHSSHIKNKLDAFNLFINDDILNLILECTNLKLEVYIQEQLNRGVQVDGNLFKSVTMCELKAFVGILIAMGANHDESIDLKNLWSNSNLLTSRFYLTVMSR